MQLLDLLPEMLLEIRQRCDTRTRVALRRTCRVLYQADPGFAVLPAWVTRVRELAYFVVIHELWDWAAKYTGKTTVDIISVRWTPTGGFLRRRGLEITFETVDWQGSTEFIMLRVYLNDIRIMYGRSYPVWNVFYPDLVSITVREMERFFDVYLLKRILPQ